MLICKYPQKFQWLLIQVGLVQKRSLAVIYLLFSMVGSYESTNCPSTNWIVSEDFPVKQRKERSGMKQSLQVVTTSLLTVDTLIFYLSNMSSMWFI